MRAAGVSSADSTTPRSASLTPSVRVVFLTLAAVSLAVIYFAWGAAVASAAPVPTWTTSCTTGDVNFNLCQNQNERLEYIASELSAIDANGTSSSSTTATLSADDQTRLDYTWWGVWALVGLGLVTLMAGQWHRTFKIGQGAQ